MQKPFTQLGQRHNIIRQFTPNWFTVSMGTGVVALIISEFPMIKALTWQLGTGCGISIFYCSYFLVCYMAYVGHFIRTKPNRFFNIQA